MSANDANGEAPRKDVFRMVKTVAGLVFATCLFAPGIGWASTVDTPEQATDRAHSEGFGLVSKTEKALGSWEVWASKDGIPYEVRIDAASGLVLDASPIQGDD